MKTALVFLAALALIPHANKPPVPQPIKCTDVACCYNPASGGGASNCCQSASDPCPIQ